MARARERIWSPGGVKVQHVSLQCMDLRTLGVGWAISAKKRSFADAVRRNPLAGPSLSGANTEKSSHQTKCHLLIESATDETPAEAMLPPQKSRF